MLGFLFFVEEDIMKYTPDRTDKRIRAVYCILFAVAIIGMLMDVKGIYTILIQCAAIIILTASVTVFIKYESITYTYSLIEKGGILDFYVDKYTGKRGGYVCYFPLTDCVNLKEFNKETKKELREEYKRIYFFNYSKNVFTGKKYVAVFENNDEYHAVIFEPDDKFLSLMQKGLNNIDF